MVSSASAASEGLRVFLRRWLRAANSMVDTQVSIPSSEAKEGHELRKVHPSTGNADILLLLQCVRWRCSLSSFDWFDRVGGPALYL